MEQGVIVEAARAMLDAGYGDAEVQGMLRVMWWRVYLVGNWMRLL